MKDEITKYWEDINGVYPYATATDTTNCNAFPAVNMPERYQSHTTLRLLIKPMNGAKPHTKRELISRTN